MRICYAAFLAVLLAAPPPARSADTDDEADLTGRWDAVKDDGFIRFDPVGNFRWVTRNGTAEGRFRQLSGGALELDVPRAGRRYAWAEYKYRLSSDTLRIRVGGRWVAFKKAG